MYVKRWRHNKSNADMLFAMGVLIAATGNKFIILKILHTKETIAIKAKQTSPNLLSDSGMF